MIHTSQLATLTTHPKTHTHFPQTNAGLDAGKEVSRRACNQTAEERAKMRYPFCLS